jgi:hypothetical protein
MGPALLRGRTHLLPLQNREANFAWMAQAVLTRASPRYGSRVNGRHAKTLVNSVE